MSWSGVARASYDLQEELKAIKLSLKEQKATEERLRNRLKKQDVTSSHRKEVALLILQPAAYQASSYTTAVHVLLLRLEQTHVLTRFENRGLVVSHPFTSFVQCGTGILLSPL